MAEKLFNHITHVMHPDNVTKPHLEDEVEYDQNFFGDIAGARILAFFANY